MQGDVVSGVRMHAGGPVLAPGMHRLAEDTATRPA